jgi:hypothetical protein
MGKHSTKKYPRAKRDLYPTIDPRPIAALAEHFDFVGRAIWEPAAGNGDMVAAMLRAGARAVYASDIEQRGFPLDCLHDFVNGERAPTSIRDIVTNPPFGDRGKLAEAFIVAGLRHIGDRGVLALLLPCDFDSGVTRRKYFVDCELFAAKLVITPGRIVWFKRTDGERPAPQENSAWYLWNRRARQRRGFPELRYARGDAS